jgi:predicted RNA-binding Zn-ribbon protein involved in translation (DUF1610 family)
VVTTLDLAGKALGRVGGVGIIEALACESIRRLIAQVGSSPTKKARFLVRRGRLSVLELSALNFNSGPTPLAKDGGTKRPEETMIVEVKIHRCPNCKSPDIIRNGTDYKGDQKYHCHQCGGYGTLNPKVAIARTRRHGS